MKCALYVIVPIVGFALFVWWLNTPPAPQYHWDQYQQKMVESAPPPSGPTIAYSHPNGNLFSKSGINDDNLLLYAIYKDGDVEFHVDQKKALDPAIRERLDIHLALFYRFMGSPKYRW